MGNIDDQHRNTNKNDKDHLVGQLTSLIAAPNQKEIASPLFRGSCPAETVADILIGGAEFDRGRRYIQILMGEISQQYLCFKYLINIYA